MDKSLIDQYAAGGPLLAAAIQGLGPADFAAVPVPGAWTIAQIVLHLMDSDLIASDRMKRIIAEDNPTLIGYNESAFAARLHYELQDPFLAADIFRRNRELTSVILRHLPDSAFARMGTHNERGKITLADMVAMYVQHVEHHLRFLRHKRQLLGKPL